MTTDMEKEREAFEAWARPRHYWLERMAAAPDQYSNTETQKVFSCWQARAALAVPAAPQEQPSDDEIDKLWAGAHWNFSGETGNAPQRFARALLSRYGAAPQGGEDAEPPHLNMLAIEAAAIAYIDDYELRTDEGCHTPTEDERFLITDAVMGLLADDDFMRLLSIPQPAGRDAPKTPRYDSWKHLCTHGQWPDGVPAWARDFDGRMNTSVALRAVIDELAVALATEGDGREP